MTNRQIKTMSKEELIDKAALLREEISDLRISMQLGEVQNVKSLRTRRKDLARLLTEANTRDEKESSNV